MIDKRKTWKIKEHNKYKAAELAEELQISPLVTGILLERGFSEVDEIKEFLYGSHEPFHNPFLMRGMEQAVRRIEKAMEAGEKITVYGDYDVDGITASSLLYVYLRGRGANVDTYIPRRENEGYGLNDDALKSLHERGTKLVITVDCGISGVNEVAKAPVEMDIIITDHHTVPDILPPAYTVIDPKQKDCLYPFKDLSGVGVAFKLCQALEKQNDGDEEFWEGLTELAALGTVADIVPLLGENREIVRRGLRAMRKTKLVGLRALLEASKCPAENITSESIGFRIAPRLNAAGRLEHAQSAVELLVTDNADRAREIADKLNAENERRQEISKRIMEEAEAMLAREAHLDTAIILASEGWHQGVIGIVASRLVDKYHLPTVLLSLSDGVAKGSCRSIPALNIYKAIASTGDLLTQFGGHHQAAGLTMDAGRVSDFKERFRVYVRQNLQENDFYPVLAVDCVVDDGRKITMADMKALSLLEPCGCENPHPIFAFKNAFIRSPRTMGVDGKHLSFTVGQNDNAYRAVMWNNGSLLPYLINSRSADVAFVPRVNVFNNETSIQLNALSVQEDVMICDLRSAHDDKINLLSNVVRTGSSVYICCAFAADNFVSEKLLARGCKIEGCVNFISYDDLPANFAVHDKIVLYDIPPTTVHDILLQLKAKGATEIIVLYNKRDYSEACDVLRKTSMNNEKMTGAYKKVMAVLQAQGVVPYKQMLTEEDECVSAETLKILEELDFIVIENGMICRGNIVKRSLEESPLYVKLNTETKNKEKLLKDNLSIPLSV